MKIYEAKDVYSTSLRVFSYNERKSLWMSTSMENVESAATLDVNLNSKQVQCLIDVLTQWLQTDD